MPTPLFSETTILSERLLVFDCHEAWVHQLRVLGRPMDIVIGLRGRHTQSWDERMRPIPAGARLLRLEEALRTDQPYGCILAHNLTDLLDVKYLPGPRIFVIHETLDGAAREQKLAVSFEEFRSTVGEFVRQTGTHVVTVSQLKGKSWGFEDDVVPFSADTADYLEWRGDLVRGLRVSNYFSRRPQILLRDFHQRAFGGLPVTLVGHNPEMPDAAGPAQSWEHLKQIFRQHRFYIHTADPRLEDGYNMATVEAMAAGLPVLGNRNPTSPVEHGVNGFLSDDPIELRSFALHLLENRDLAARMGAAARKTVARHFSPELFQRRFEHSVATAQQKWLERKEDKSAREIIPASAVGSN